MPAIAVRVPLRGNSNAIVQPRSLDYSQRRWHLWRLAPNPNSRPLSRRPSTTCRSGETLMNLNIPRAPAVDRLDICTAVTVHCHLSLCLLSLQAQAREARARRRRGTSHRSRSRCQRSRTSQWRDKPSSEAPDPGAGLRPAMPLSRCAAQVQTADDDAESCCSRETSRIGRLGTSTTCPALRPGVGSAIRPRQVQTRRRSSLTRWAAGSMCLRPPLIHKMSRVLRATRLA